MYGERQVSSARGTAGPSSRAARAALITSRGETCRAMVVPFPGLSRSERPPAPPEESRTRAHISRRSPRSRGISVATAFPRGIPGPRAHVAPKTWTQASNSTYLCVPGDCMHRPSRALLFLPVVAAVAGGPQRQVLLPIARADDRHRLRRQRSELRSLERRTEREGDESDLPPRHSASR